MPTLNYLTCQILHGITEEPLQEWGQQTLKKVDGSSCYVQADTGRPFAIKITHDMPFPPVQDVIAEAEDFERNTYQKVTKRDHSPYHLLGTLRFDGRTKAERRVLVYLDENHTYFKSEIIMSGRHAPGDDGNLWWHRWVFNEVGQGIDTLLDGMSLAPSGKEGEKVSSEDELVELLNGIDAKCEDKEEASKAGLLEITFERCTVAEQAYHEEYRPENDESNQDDGEKAGKDISHKAGRAVSSKKEGKTMHYISFELFGDEKPWATFQFKYRSEDVLRKFGFPGFPQKVVVPDEDMSNLSVNRTPTEQTGHKRSKSKGDDGDDEDESPSKTKRVAIKSSKDDKRKADFDTSRASEESDDEDEAHNQVERPQMSNGKGFFDGFTGHKAPKRVSTGDSDKENQDEDAENGTGTANKNPKKKVAALGLNSSSKKEKSYMATSQAILSNIDGSEEEPDVDKKEVEEDDGFDGVA